MLLALTLGLTGSFGHCVGMCSAVIMLLRGQPGIGDSRGAWALLHAGRIGTYAFLGLIAGFFGQQLGFASSGMQGFQGFVAILAGLAALFFAFSLIGWLPSPDIYLSGWTARWRTAMQSRLKDERTGSDSSMPLMIGFLWGFLPCGLVLTALFTAAVSTSPLMGMLRMLVFGLATLPALLGIHWLLDRFRTLSWSRYIAAIAMLAFAGQFTMRGLAAWGWVDHLMMRGVMLW